MIGTKNSSLEDWHKVYVYTSDGNCTMCKGYDYDFQDGWFKVDGLNESKYFRESIVDMVFIEEFGGVSDND